MQPDCQGQHNAAEMQQKMKKRANYSPDLLVSTQAALSCTQVLFERGTREREDRHGKR